MLLLSLCVWVLGLGLFAANPTPKGPNDGLAKLAPDNRPFGYVDWPHQAKVVVTTNSILFLWRIG